MVYNVFQPRQPLFQPFLSFYGCLLCSYGKLVNLSSLDFLSVSICILIIYSSPSSTLFSLCRHLHPHYLSLFIFLLIFCLSPSLSSFSVCLHLSPHFLSVSIFILIFCLSLSFSLFSICHHLPHFLSVSIYEETYRK